mmetsp:Transcript_11790/g.35569  ORF Transcript_11790/g.35569 Transcript_11790/m.35569 type:complete len:278 (+) Transcript_11790:73-906(+)
MDLGDVHKAQLSRFAAFFRGKRDRAVADREAEKSDFITDRLADESAIFNYADVRLLLDAYHNQVMASLRDELEKTANLSAVFAAQLLGQAEAAGVTLQVEDISVIEDQNRLGEIGALPAVNAPPLAPKKAALTAVGGTGTADPAVLQELQDLKEENRVMKDRNMHLQTEISGALRERSALAAELDQVKTSLTGAQQAGGGDANAAEYQRQLTEKHAELESLKRELNQRLGDSSQFRELKSIVQKKSAENKELKQRLAAAGLAAPDEGACVELEADSD